MIVGGYAFIPSVDNVTVTSIYDSGRATLMRKDGEVLETNMEDVELDIVSDLWLKNCNLYEEAGSV